MTQLPPQDPSAILPPGPPHAGSPGAGHAPRPKPTFAERRARIGRAFGRFGLFLDATRRVVVNGLFLVILLAFGVATCRGGGGLTIHDDSALVLDLDGAVVEERSGDPFAALMGGGEQEVLLADILYALEKAGDDERIGAIVLELSQFGGGGLSKMQEIGDAMEAVRAKGKKVIATADNYSQSSYYLAAHADEVWLHEMGGVGVEGLARYTMYFKDAIDRLEVTWHVFKVGKFKSAVEPYTSTGPSPEAREADLAWMNDLWGAYLSDVAAARSMDATKLRDYANNFDVHVRSTSGDLSKLALDFGLVDRVGHRDEVRARVIELVGEDTKKHEPHQVALAEYVKHWRARDLVAWGKPKKKVAVVVARGMILDGEQAPGTVGGDSTAALIRKARLDDDVVAVVLRVDSPGGSAFASEIIRRELQLVRDAGKPVVVSMGSVAASGGYWISTSADEIWASPTTITGSIGIFGMFPGVDRMLDRYVGVRVDGVATGPFADGIRPDRPLDPRVGATIQLEIEKGYRDFLNRVANARGMSVDAVDVVAQGRVWSGSKAKELGLVDELGDLDDAVASAAKRAEVEKYRVEVVRKEPGFAEALAEALAGENVRWTIDLPFAGWADPSRRALGGITGDLVRRHEEQLRLMSSFNDPNGVYAWAPVPMD